MLYWTVLPRGTSWPPGPSSVVGPPPSRSHLSSNAPKLATPESSSTFPRHPTHQNLLSQQPMVKSSPAWTHLSAKGSSSSPSQQLTKSSQRSTLIPQRDPPPHSQHSNRSPHTCGSPWHVPASSSRRTTQSTPSSPIAGKESTLRCRRVTSET